MKKINLFLMALGFVSLVGCSSNPKENIPSPLKEKMKGAEMIMAISYKENSVNQVNSFLLKDDQAYAMDSNQSIPLHPVRLVKITF
jgi:uncharacterized protein YcfL